MRLIDADALIDSMGLANAVKWGNKDGYQQDNSYSTLMRYEIKDDIDAQPTIDAVTLDRLCEWLPNAVDSCPANPEWHNGKCLHMECEECWKEAICNWMGGWNKHAAD